MRITTYSPTRLERSSFGLCAAILQLALWWAFALFVDYEFPDSSSSETREKPTSRSAHETFVDHNTNNNCYHMFEDVRIMLFIGFGLLRVFQKSNEGASPTVNIILAAITLQWSVICDGLFYLHERKIEFKLSSLLNAEMALAAAFISCGAVISKASPLQLITMTFCETALFFINKHLLIEVLQTSDTGGSVYVHLFAAYFGIMVSFILSYGHSKNSSEESNSKHSLDGFFMKGTIFLWVFWPLFNASLANGAAQHRAIIHTYCAMSSCCATVFAATLFFKQDKFDAKTLMDATLAGGIAVGTAGDLMIKPFGALIIGVIAGAVNVLSDVLYNKLEFCSRLALDTSGIHSTHGLPGLLAGLSGAVMAIMASEKAYSYSLYQHYPAMVPKKGTHELWSIEIHFIGIKPGTARTALAQGAFQIAAICTTLVIASLGGLATGLFLRFTLLGKTSRHVLDDNQTQDSPKEVV